MVKTVDVLGALGYRPKVWGSPTTPRKPKTDPKPPKDDDREDLEKPLLQGRDRELQKETKWWRELKAKWKKELDDADDQYPNFSKWLDTLEDEQECGMPKPGIVDWDVVYTIHELRMVELPLPVRMMALDQFKRFVRKVQRRHGWTEADDPFPKNFGGYTSDWDRVKLALDVR